MASSPTITETPTDEPLIHLALGLRALADFLDANPGLPAPHVFAGIWQYSGGTEAFRPVVEAMRATGGAEITFDEGSDYMGGQRHKITATRYFGPIKFEIEADSNKVCEQRVVTRDVSESVLPGWLS